MPTLFLENQVVIARFSWSHLGRLERRRRLERIEGLLSRHPARRQVVKTTLAGQLAGRYEAGSRPVSINKPGLNCPPDSPAPVQAYGPGSHQKLESVAHGNGPTWGRFPRLRDRGGQSDQFLGCLDHGCRGERRCLPAPFRRLECGTNHCRRHHCKPLRMNCCSPDLWPDTLQCGPHRQNATLRKNDRRPSLVDPRGGRAQRACHPRFDTPLDSRQSDCAKVPRRLR